MKTIATVALLVVCLQGSTTTVSAAEGGAFDVLTSTLKIITRLCYANGGGNKSNQTLIDDFFGCYDQAPGKDSFVKCQTQLFGGPLDNVPAVSASCRLCTQYKLLPYSQCLRRELGDSMTSTVLTLNECQSRVLGIK